MSENLEDQQLTEWVKGNSIHNKDRDECCPDFSCCRPELLAPVHERKAFAKYYLSGDEKSANGMLMAFLSRVLSKISDKKIYVTEQENHNGN